LIVESLRQIQPDFGGANPDDLQVYQPHFSGHNQEDQDLDQPAYLSLNKAEAKMVSNEVQQPSRKEYMLYFTWWMHVRVEHVSGCG